MDLSNINSNLQLDSTQNTDTSLLTTLATTTTTTSTSNQINTNFQPVLNETSEEMLQQVEYKASQDILKEKAHSLSLQEEQRMLKMQQKELLISLQKTNNVNGSTYSRNMDDSAVLNSPKKDLDNQSTKPITNQRLQVDDSLEDKINIDTAAEKFLNSQNKKNSTEPESTLKEFEEQKRKKDEDNQKKKRNLYDFEDDEVVDLNLGKLSTSSHLDRIKGVDQNLMLDVTRYQNTNKLKSRIENHKINPALEKALKKDKQKNNINKLRQKFNKK